MLVWLVISDYVYYKPFVISNYLYYKPFWLSNCHTADDHFKTGLALTLEFAS